MSKHAAIARTLTTLVAALFALCLAPMGAFAAVELAGNEEGLSVAAVPDATGDASGGASLVAQLASQPSASSLPVTELGSQAAPTASALGGSPDATSDHQRLLGSSAASGLQLRAASDFRQSLPIVYLHIDGGQAAVDAMNASEDHSVHCDGTMDIVVPEGFRYVDSTAQLTGVTGVAFDIRGRGNTSWDADKKPYKIKLNKKTPLLGMGKNKHWALLANAYDPTLLRNRITYWLGREMGLAYTPSCYPVDVFMEGVYLGNYYLSETIRLDSSRVDIDELEAGDTELPDITGGYLVQFMQDSDTPALFTTDKGVDLQNVSPNFDVADGGYENDAQRDYIRNYIQEAEYAINEHEIADPSDPSGYRALDARDYIDTDSAALYWLMNKLSANMDAYGTGSTYFYKTRDADTPGKIFWGPLWDFDYAWDFTGDAVDNELGLGRDAAWMVAMLTDHSADGLPARVRALWPKLRNKALSIVEKDGLLDQYREELRVSQDQSKEQYRGEDGDPLNYDEAIERLRQWIVARVAYVDGIVDGIDRYAYRVSYKNDENDQHPRVYCHIAGEDVSDEVEAPEKDGHIFVGWFSEDGIDAREMTVDHDVTMLPRFVSREDATKVSTIYFLSDHIYVEKDRETYYPRYTLYPKDALDQTVVWTSSDDAIATVGEEGDVAVRGKVGTVTITAQLPTGASSSYQLTVVDKLQIPESIRLERDTLEMQVGDIQQARLAVAPVTADYGAYFSIEEETDVAICDEVGMVFAQKPGRVVATADVVYRDSAGAFHEEKLEFTVIVREAGEEPGGEEAGGNGGEEPGGEETGGEEAGGNGGKESGGNDGKAGDAGGGKGASSGGSGQKGTANKGNEQSAGGKKTAGKSAGGKQAASTSAGGKQVASKRGSGSAVTGAQAATSTPASTGTQTSSPVATGTPASTQLSVSAQTYRQDLAQTGDGTGSGVAWTLAAMAVVLLTVGSRMRKV